MCAIQICPESNLFLTLGRFALTLRYWSDLLIEASLDVRHFRELDDRLVFLQRASALLDLTHYAHGERRFSLFVNMSVNAGVSWIVRFELARVHYDFMLVMK